MRKISEIIVVTVLCIAVLFGVAELNVTSINLFAVKVQAASICDLAYTITNNEVNITGFRDYASASGELTIPATIEDYPVTSRGNFALYSCTGLTSIKIPDSVTTIGYRAFESCTALTSVTIPDSVTSIGEATFRGCTGLTSVTIGNSVTSIGNSAFSGCTGLTSVTIGNSVTSIGNYAFAYCDGLTSITIPKSVTNIGNSAFSGCKGLESIAVERGNRNYQSKGNCLIETENKTLVLGCKNSIIPNNENVTSIGNYAFDGCTGLTSLAIPDNVTSIGNYAFYGCTGLTSVIIPDSVTSIGNSAFSGCNRIFTLTVPYSVNYIGTNAFYNVTNVAYTGTATGSPWDAKCVNGVVDGDLLFNNSSRLKLVACCIDASGSVTLPASVDTIEDNAFKNCSDITDIYIPINVTRIGNNAFSGSGIKEVYYEGAVIDKMGMSIADGNTKLTDATWHYNSKISDMPGSPSNPDNPGNPDNPSTDIPEANIITGNASNNQKTYDYRTTVTFTANVPSGGKVQWYVDGKPAGTDKTLTVKDMKTDYTVKVVVTDKNGNQTMDEEQVTIKHGFFDIIIWFFVHLFNPGAYDVKQ